MNQKPHEESPPNIKQQVNLKISAKKSLLPTKRIAQGDIFHDIQIIESVEIVNSLITIKKIDFPYIVCLNQECDLENDFNLASELSDSTLLHLAIAPAFNFDQFLSGTHWGGILHPKTKMKRTDTTVKKIIDNEIPRYHYLKFPDTDMPELVIDFKHFFTINREELYKRIDQRLCSLDDLFKEKINQRFSYYVSRIGLPTN